MHSHSRDDGKLKPKGPVHRYIFERCSEESSLSFTQVEESCREIDVSRDDIIGALGGHGKKLREIIAEGLTRSRSTLRPSLRPLSPILLPRSL